MARRVGRYRPMARRKLVWARTTTTAAVLETGTDLLDVFRTMGGDTLGATVTRIRLDLTQISTTVTASGGLTAGILVDQLQLDPTQVPLPVDEPHADWMYWRRLPVVSPEGGHSFEAQTGTVIHTSYQIDVQSQRKIEELGQTLWLQLQASGVAVPTSAFFAASVLLKLP